MKVSIDSPVISRVAETDDFLVTLSNGAEVVLREVGTDSIRIRHRGAGLVSITPESSNVVTIRFTND